MIDKLQNIYNNQLSDIIGQQQSEGTRGVTTTDSKGRNSELKKIAKEMEAVFAYQLIKEMRKISNSTLSKNDLGSDTYISMFDMEISKLFAERGLGLQDAMMRWMERAENKTNVNHSDETDGNATETEMTEKTGALHKT